MCYHQEKETLQPESTAVEQLAHVGSRQQSRLSDVIRQHASEGYDDRHQQMWQCSKYTSLDVATVESIFCRASPNQKQNL